LGKIFYFCTNFRFLIKLSILDQNLYVLGAQKCGRVLHGHRNFGQNWVSGRTFVQKIESLIKNRKFVQKIESLIKNRKFAQKSKICSKIEILAKNRFGDSFSFFFLLFPSIFISEEIYEQLSTVAIDNNVKS